MCVNAILQDFLGFPLNGRYIAQGVTRSKSDPGDLHTTKLVNDIVIQSGSNMALYLVRLNLLQPKQINK